MTPWRLCSKCGKIVKINKPIFGSLHLCAPKATPVQIAAMQAMKQQQDYMRAYPATAALSPQPQPKPAEGTDANDPL